MEWRPFELHPDIPEEGSPRPNRDSPTAAYLREALMEAGLPYRRVEVARNSGRSLALSAWATGSAEWPDLHRALFHAYWAEGADISDVEVLVEIATGAGIDAAAARGGIREGAAAVRRSTGEALELGISGTPGWHFRNGAVLTGAHPHEALDRLMAHLGIPARVS